MYIFQHAVGLMYRTGKLEVTSDVRSKPLEKKRKRGRPGKIPLCLTRSPPNRDMSDTTEVVQDEDVSEPELQLSPVPSAIYQPPLDEQHAESDGPSAAPCSPSPSSSPQPPAKKRKIARQLGEPRPEKLRRSKRTRK